MNEIKNVHEDLKISNHLNYFKQYNDEGYNISFMNKKEIYNIKKDDEKFEKRTRLRHQKILSVFMSSYNLNRGILLFHEMGSGKV